MAYNSAFTRRRALQLAGLGAAGTTLAACAGPGSGGNGGGNGNGNGGDGGGGEEETTALDPANASGNISFAHWRGEDQAAFDTLIASFIEEYPDVEGVRQDISPSNDYQSNALAQIRQGTIGDIFASFRGFQLTQMKDAGMLVDLAETGVADNYEESLVAEGIVDGAVFALPYQLVFNQPITNEDILESAGISELPTDWDSYVSALDAIKSQGVTPIAWPGADMGNAGQFFNGMIMNIAPSDDMCAKIEAGEYKVTDDWFLEMLRLYQELIPYFQDNATGSAPEPAQQMFASGQAAMLATGSYHVAAVRALGAEFPIGMMSPITSAPGEMKYIGVHNATFALGVSTASENQDTAFALLEFLSRPDIAGQYGSETAQHVTVSGAEYSNDDLVHLENWVTEETMLAPRFQFNNLDIRNAAEGACIAVVGGASPEQAAEEAQEVIDQQVGA